MSKPTKRQHYIPRFYLKRFSRDSTSIYVYDKFKNVEFESNIVDVGQENYFYQMPVLDQEHLEELKKENLDEKTMLENVLSIYDDACAKYLNNTISSINVSKLLSRNGSYQFMLSDDLKFGIGLFAAITDLRTKETREKFAQLNHLLTESSIGFIAETKFPEVNIDQFKIQTREDIGSVFQAKLLLDQNHLNGIANVSTFHRIWMIAINNTSTPLIVSDHPILKRSHLPDSVYGGGGWASLGLEVGIPLSPKLMIVLFCPTIYEKAYNYGLEWTLNNTVLELTEENVMYYNSLQCSNSYRFLYQSEPQWDLARKFLLEFPEHQNPVRQKVALNGFGKQWKLHDDWRMPRSNKK